jgi:AraC family transcriptional regulator
MNEIMRRATTWSAPAIGSVTLVEKIHRSTLRLGTHRHDRPYLCWVASGSFREEIRGASRHVGPGCLLSNLDDVPHANRYSEGAVRSLVFVMDEPPPGVPGEGLWPARTEAACFASAIDLELGTSDDCAATIMEELFAGLFQSMTPHARQGTPLPDQAPPWLERVRERLDEEFLLPMCLRSLAAEAGVHPDHLTRCFKRFYRTTAGNYARRRRLEWAAAKLVSSPEPLAEVALESGFADQSHFTRHFRRRFGLPPRRYRRTFSASRG